MNSTVALRPCLGDCGCLCAHAIGSSRSLTLRTAKSASSQAPVARDSLGTPIRQGPSPEDPTVLKTPLRIEKSDGVGVKFPIFAVNCSRFPLSSGRIPSDTKLVLTKIYSEIIIFENLRISYVIPRKSPSFQEISRVQNPSRITKNNSQGIIFVIISCQRVREKRRKLKKNGQKRRKTKKKRKIPPTPICTNPILRTSQKKGTQTQTFGVWISSGGVGVFHVKGRGSST